MSQMLKHPADNPMSGDFLPHEQKSFEVYCNQQTTIQENLSKPKKIDASGKKSFLFRLLEVFEPRVAHMPLLRS